MRHRSNRTDVPSDRFTRRPTTRSRRPPWPLWGGLAILSVLLLIAALWIRQWDPPGSRSQRPVPGVADSSIQWIDLQAAPGPDVPLRRGASPDLDATDPDGDQDAGGPREHTEATSQASVRAAASGGHEQILPAVRSGQPLVAADVKPRKVRSHIRGDGLPPKAPNPWFFVERAYPYGEIPLAQWQAANIAARMMRAEAGPRAEVWTAAGPTNIGGRITDLAVHPSDENTLYVGAAEGGVLKSSDGGLSWAVLTDDLPSLSVGALAIDPSDADVIYLGTGEVNPGGGSVAYGGAGLFRSTDGGSSWSPLGLEDTGSIGRIRVDPGDSDRVFVAAMGHLWTAGSERGVYRTTDGGDSWEQVLFVNDSTGCVDLIMRPDNPDVLYAAAWERIRRPESYRYGGGGCAVYRTTDGGDSWTLVAGGLPAPGAEGGRIGLSLCAAEPDVMHAVYADRIGYFDGLYRSTNGGYSWVRTNDGSLSGIFASYGWWFGNVRTHPLHADWIYVLGLDFYRSTNGGGSYTNASGSMHVDHHALDFGPGADPVIYNGNDGGVYRSTNGGTYWTKSPDLPITQIYRVALDASRPGALYCGTQDNGTCRTLSGALDDWEMIFGGDGFQPLVHPTNPQRVWAQYQYGNLYYSSDGGGYWSWARGGISSGDRFNWNSPLVQDPTDPDRRFFGTQRLYRSTGNTSWTAISPDLTGGIHQGNSGQVDGILTSVGVSVRDGNVLWTGSDDGYVQVTENGGASWTLVSATLPDRWVTAVRPCPHERERAYVTFSGFRWGEPLPRIFRSADLGATWLSVSGNLPDAPVNDLLIDPQDAAHLIAATDVGVFRSFDGGAQWTALGGNFPNVVVTSLAFEPGSRMLVAGTYGRSFFTCTLESSADVDHEAAPAPVAAVLHPPQPNPAQHAAGTMLRWYIPRAATVEVEIFTAAGRRVCTSGPRGATVGEGRYHWTGRDARERPVPSGAYFARLVVDGRVAGQQTILWQR